MVNKNEENTKNNNNCNEFYDTRSLPWYILFAVILHYTIIVHVHCTRLCVVICKDGCWFSMANLIIFILFIWCNHDFCMWKVLECAQNCVNKLLFFCLKFFSLVIQFVDNELDAWEWVKKENLFEGHFNKKRKLL